MADYDITSPSNERIKRLVRLRDRRHRDEAKVFVVEGERLVGRALDAGLEAVEVYVDTADRGHYGPGTLSVAPRVLDKASYRSRSEGVIAVFEQFPTDLSVVDLGSRPLLLVAESIEKPGNLGAMLRTADSVGADALIIVGGGIDPFNPNVVRSSTGSLFTVRLATADLDELSIWLDERSIPLVTALPDGDIDYWDTDLTGPVAIMVGAEDAGISAEARRLANRSLAIPMSGSADSLNASVSLAVVAFEAVRQRSAAD